MDHTTKHNPVISLLMINILMAETKLHPTINTCLIPFQAAFKSNEFIKCSTPDPKKLDEATTSTQNPHIECPIDSTCPDGGWGWVVVFAAFMTNLIADGITYSFGIMYVEFLHYFKASKGKTAWIGSLFMAIPLLAGPVASALTDRFGCRKVTIAGALLAALGFVLSSFSESMELLFLTFGIMSGLGLALCYVAAVAIVAYYFEKRRAFATGLAVSGSGIGTFIFAQLTHHMIREYQWQGTTLILAGFFLNIVVCGSLMRDLEWTKKKQSDKPSSESLMKKEISHSDEKKIVFLRDVTLDEITSERLCNSLVQLPTFLKNSNSLPPDLLEMLSNNKVTYEFVLEHYPHLLTGSQSELMSRNNEKAAHISTLKVSRQNPCSKCRLTPSSSWTKTTPNRRVSTAYFHNLRIHRHSITHRGAMLNIHRYHLRVSSCPDIYRNSMITVSREHDNAFFSFTQEIKEILMDMINISYFKNIKFLIFCLSNSLLYVWYDVPYILIADNAILMGISEVNASYLISVIGILNTIGEVLLGYIGDKPWVNTTLLYAMFTAVCGMVLIVVPVLKDFYSLCVVAGTFGFAISANYALTSIIIVDLISLENFTNAYGLLLMFQGVANLVGPPLAGWLYDLTNSYDLSFYMAGLWIFISGAMMTILPLFKFCRQWNVNPTENEGGEQQIPTKQSCAFVS